MGFRDDHEAARARTAPRAWRVLLVASIVVVLSVAFAAYEHRAREEEARVASDVRTALATALGDVSELRAERDMLTAWSDPPPGVVVPSEWDAPGTASARLLGTVDERIGDTPAGIGASCIAQLTRHAPTAPHEPVSCEVDVTCDGSAIFPVPDASTRGTCSRRMREGFDIDAQSGARRVRAHDGIVRIDDGASGTWSFAFRADPR